MVEASSSGMASLAAGAIHDTTALNVISKTLNKVQEVQAQGHSAQQASAASLRISVQQASGIGTRVNTVA